MLQVTEGNQRLEVVSLVSLGTRLFFALAALVPLLAPYELLWRVNWTTYWHPFFLVAALVSAGAVAVSALLMFAAVAGLSSRMTFDAANTTFTYFEVAPVVAPRSVVLPLSSLADVRVEVTEWSDGAPSYSLLVETSEGTAYRCGSWGRRAKFEETLERVQSFLERSRPPVSA